MLSLTSKIGSRTTIAQCLLHHITIDFQRILASWTPTVRHISRIDFLNTLVNNPMPFIIRIDFRRAFANRSPILRHIRINFVCRSTKIPVSFIAKIDLQTKTAAQSPV